MIDIPEERKVTVTYVIHQNSSCVLIRKVDNSQLQILYENLVTCHHQKVCMNYNNILPLRVRCKKAWSILARLAEYWGSAYTSFPMFVSCSRRLEYQLPIYIEFLNLRRSFTIEKLPIHFVVTANIVAKSTCKQLVAASGMEFAVSFVVLTPIYSFFGILKCWWPSH